MVEGRGGSAADPFDHANEVVERFYASWRETFKKRDKDQRMATAESLVELEHTLQKELRTALDPIFGHVPVTSSPRIQQVYNDLDSLRRLHRGHHRHRCRCRFRSCRRRRR